MKRLFLLPVLMFGLSFACDQPSEEVAGIKIGCPLGSSVDYREYTTGGQVYGGGAVSRELTSGFFKTETILSIDGIVEGIILNSGNNISGEKDFTALVGSMKERWGEPIVNSEHSNATALFINHRNDIIELVGVLLSKNENVLSVVYRTSKSLEAEKREESLRGQQFKGL